MSEYFQESLEELRDLLGQAFPVNTVSNPVTLQSTPMKEPSVMFTLVEEAKQAAEPSIQEALQAAMLKAFNDLVAEGREFETKTTPEGYLELRIKL